MNADKWTVLNNTLENMRKCETPAPSGTAANYLNTAGLAISDLPESLSAATVKRIAEAVYAAFQAGRRTEKERIW